MAVYALTDSFAYFFTRLNPSDSFRHKASSEYSSIQGLIEAPAGPAAALSPQCFLHGSYDRDTAIYTINDIDIVVLCKLQHPPIEGAGRSWSRNEIFATIAAPLLADKRYENKISYRDTSMCIKVDLGIKVEILPVVYRSGTSDPTVEPFRLHRPETGNWEDGYARYHQAKLTEKNKATNGNFIPAIKVMKHLRSLHGVEGVSFHVECLLYSFANSVFTGGPADYIPNMLNHLTSTPAMAWSLKVIHPPCEKQRELFSSTEWDMTRWIKFHKASERWTALAMAANSSLSQEYAITKWKELLGDSYFPREVTK